MLLPVQYPKIIEKALTTDRLSCHVVGIFIVLDCVGFIAPLMVYTNSNYILF